MFLSCVAEKASTIGVLLDRNAIEVVPYKKPTTRAGNILAIATLRKMFGTLPLHAITPQQVYIFVDKKRKKKRNDVAIWSAA